jgi:hypothetical protein
MLTLGTCPQLAGRLRAAKHQDGEHRDFLRIEAER